MVRGPTLKDLRQHGVNALVLDVQALGDDRERHQHLRRSPIIRSSPRDAPDRGRARWKNEVAGIAHAVAACSRGIAGLRCAVRASSQASARTLAGTPGSGTLAGRGYASGPAVFSKPARLPRPADTSSSSLRSPRASGAPPGRPRLAQAAALPSVDMAVAPPERAPFAFGAKVRQPARLRRDTAGVGPPPFPQRRGKAPARCHAAHRARRARRRGHLRRSLRSLSHHSSRFRISRSKPRSRRIVEGLAAQLLRQIVLTRKGVGLVVIVAIAVAVALFLHQLGRRVENSASAAAASHAPSRRA